MGNVVLEAKRLYNEPRRELDPVIQRVGTTADQTSLRCLASSLLQGLHPRPLLRHHPEPSVLPGRGDSGSGPREAAVQRGPAGAAREPGPGGRHLRRRSGDADLIFLRVIDQRNDVRVS